MGNALETFKTQAQQKIRSNSTYQSANSWYQALSQRDARIVRVLASAIAVALVYLWVWVPAENYNNQAANKLMKETALHAFMKENAYKVSSGAGRSSVTSNRNQSILALINSTSKAKGVALNRFEPEGENGIRIWLDKVKFDSAIDWLDLLENERGIRVSQINIDRVEPGTVNLRAVLKR